MHGSQFKMIARSVGYRMGKRAAARQRGATKDQYAPRFDELFTPAYVPEAEAGYAEGMEFERARWSGKSRDTFHKGPLHP